MNDPHDYEPAVPPSSLTPFWGRHAWPRADDKVRVFFCHMWIFEIANLFTTMCVLNVQKSQAHVFLNKQHDLGRIQIVDNRDQASTVFMLTASGAAFARQFVGDFEKEWPPKIHPSRLPAKNECHDLIASWKAVNLSRVLMAREPVDPSRIRIMNTRMLRSLAKTGDTQADSAVKNLDTGTTYEVEVQESDDNDMPRRLSRICERLQAGTLSECHFISTKHRVLANYKGIVTSADFKPYWYHAPLRAWFPNNSKPSPYIPAVANKLVFGLVVERSRFYKHPESLRSRRQKATEISFDPREYGD